MSSPDYLFVAVGSIISVLVHIGTGVALIVIAASLRRSVSGDGWKWLLAAGIGLTLQAIGAPLTSWVATLLAAPDQILLVHGVTSLGTALGWALWWVLLLRGIVLVAGAARPG